MSSIARLEQVIALMKRCLGWQVSSRSAEEVGVATSITDTVCSMADSQAVVKASLGRLINSHRHFHAPHYPSEH